MGSAKGGDELGETMRILAGPEKQKKRRMDIRSGFFHNFKMAYWDLPQPWTPY